MLSLKLTEAEKAKVGGKRQSKGVKKVIDQNTRLNKQALRTTVRGNYSEVIYNRSKESNKAPKVFNSSIGYTFLQYVRVVYKWAMSNHGLSRMQLDALLYMYPIELFTKDDFFFYYKTIGITRRASFIKLVELGWIVQWRKASTFKKQKALYTLSSKAKVMIGKMHRMCVGEIEMTLGQNNNLTRSDKRVDDYYVEIAKVMNERVKKGA